MEQPRVRLTYLNIKGLAEPIRLALFLAGVEFEDERISYEEIAERRKSGALPHGQVPVLTAPGFPAVSQSMAILHWSAKQGKGCLWPADATTAVHHDMVEAAIGDINNILRPQWYGYILGRSPVTGELLVPMTDEQKAEVQAKLNDDILPKRFADLEKCVKGDYFCGEQMTTVDLLFYCLGDGVIKGTYCDGISPSVIENNPKLLQLVRNVDKHPKVMEWNKAASFCLDSEAVGGGYTIYEPQKAYKDS